MNNGSREMEILRKNQKEMPEIKNTDREIKPAFDVLIMRPNIMRLKEELIS